MSLFRTRGFWRQKVPAGGHCPPRVPGQRRSVGASGKKMTTLFSPPGNHNFHSLHEIEQTLTKDQRLMMNRLIGMKKKHFITANWGALTGAMNLRNTWNLVEFDLSPVGAGDDAPHAAACARCKRSAFRRGRIFRRRRRLRLFSTAARVAALQSTVDVVPRSTSAKKTAPWPSRRTWWASWPCRPSR